MDDQAIEAVASDPMDHMMEYLEAEDEETEVGDEPEAEESEPSDEESEEATEEEAPQAEEFEEITHNGEIKMVDTDQPCWTRHFRDPNGRDLGWRLRLRGAFPGRVGGGPGTERGNDIPQREPGRRRRV